jgi:hypothetical protein
MNRNSIAIGNSTRIIVIWPLMSHRWEDIIDFIENDVKIKIKDKFLAFPEKLDDKEWFEFIIGLYMSHRVSDNPGLKEIDVENKINKKIKFEFFGSISKEKRKILLLTYDIDDTTRGNLIEKVKLVCGHDNDRIELNITNKKARKHCYDQNSLKDIVRVKFKNDKNLKKYYKGTHQGRKRIAHCPESSLGVRDIMNFIHQEGIVVSEY